MDVQTLTLADEGASVGSLVDDHLLLDLPHSLGGVSVGVVVGVGVSVSVSVRVNVSVSVKY